MKLDLVLALAMPNQARIEMSGPLGVKVGLFVMNAKWLQLYVPREKVVFRFPSSEAHRDTLRRDRFFQLLPVRVDPDIWVSALSGRVDLEGGLGDCRYDPDRNAYRFRFRWREGSKWVWVDPNSAAPTELMVFAKTFPEVAQAAELRPDLRVAFTEFQGVGPATLPTHMEFFTPSGRQLVFEWKNVEAWTSSADVFEWTPPEGLQLRDY
ncbi:MAG: hypothetical protein JST16_10290 [Bdellovibrionales bacterium]|nr:hypothetical protein [Bdellovibrionales bacterium]